MSGINNESELPEREKRQKEWDAVVSAAVKDVEEQLLQNHSGFHHITFFGAMGIDPKHLAVWCFFKRDSDLNKAQDRGFTDTIQSAMRDALSKHGYPTDLTPSFFISFGTNEDVQRTCDGNYWHYLK